MVRSVRVASGVGVMGVVGHVSWERGGGRGGEGHLDWVTSCTPQLLWVSSDWVCVIAAGAMDFRQAIKRRRAIRGGGRPKRVRNGRRGC